MEYLFWQCKNSLVSSDLKQGLLKATFNIHIWPNLSGFFFLLKEKIMGKMSLREQQNRLLFQILKILLKVSLCRFSTDHIISETFNDMVQDICK